MMLWWLVLPGALILTSVGIYWKTQRKNNHELQLSPVNFIERPQKGRRLVVPDVHGCSKTLKKLLEEKVKVQPEDQLFFLGDYINKGPDSKGVLDYIISLQDSDYQVFTLKGNHEEELLDILKYTKSQNTLLAEISKKKCLNLLDMDKNLQLKPAYLHFLEQLKYFFELDDYLLVHAGFNFEIPTPFEDKEAMVWVRRYEPNLHFLKGKQIVQGHNPTPLNQIVQRIKQQNPIIKLDNGCVFLGKLTQEEKGQLGHLLCFDLDSRQLFIQRNIDK